MNSIRKEGGGAFLHPIIRSSTPEEPSDIIKFSYQPTNAPIVALMDISFVEPKIPSLTIFVPVIHHNLPIVFYTPTIDSLIAEKLRYMYVYRDTDEHYNKSLLRSLVTLIDCIRRDIPRILATIETAVYSLRLPEDEDDDIAKKYMIDQLNKLFP